MGNDFTCLTDGFINGFTAGSTPMYMFVLCLYTALKIKTTISDEEFCQKYEKKLHIAIFTINLALAVFGLATKSIATTITGNFCTFAASPPGCRQAPDLVGECEQEIDYVLPLALTTALGIPFLSLLGIVCCMAIVCIYNLRGTRFTLLSRSHHTVASPKITTSRSDPAEVVPSSSSDVHFDSSQMKMPHVAAACLAEGESTRQGGDKQERSQDSNIIAGVSLNPNTNQSDVTPTTNAAQKSYALIQFYRKEIILQACCFVVASLATFACYWALQFQILVSKHRPSADLIFAATLTYPLGGFFNMIAYTRPKIAYFRSRHPEHSLLRAFWHVIKTGGDVMRQEPAVQDNHRDTPSGDLLRKARKRNASRSVAFGVAQDIPAGGFLVGSSILQRSNDDHTGHIGDISSLTRDYYVSSTSVDHDIRDYQNYFSKAGLSLPTTVALEEHQQNFHFKKGSNDNLDPHTAGGSEFPSSMLQDVEKGSIEDADRHTVRVSNHFKDSHYSRSFKAAGGNHADLVVSASDEYDDEKERCSSSVVLDEQDVDFVGYSDLDLLRIDSEVQEGVDGEESGDAETDPVRRAYARAMNRVKYLE